LSTEYIISPLSGRDLAEAEKNRDSLSASEFSDYVYVTLPRNAPGTLIQAYEKPEHYNDSPWGKGTIVILKSKIDDKDYSAEWMDIESFQAALERTQQWLAEQKK